MNASPPLRIDYRPIETLRAYERNARTHSPAQIAQIAESIRTFGWTNPILVDELDTIIAGHGRLLAAREVGAEAVPVIRLVGLTDEQRRALVIADNKIALNAGWDEELLSAELQTLGDLQELVGFSNDELLRLLNRGNAGLTDPDDVPEPPSKPITQAGDLWRLGPHRLLCGDATKAEDVARVLDGVQPNLMVTDPPYGVDYDPTWRAQAGVNRNRQKLGRVTNDERSDWRGAYSLFPGQIAYVWHAGRYASTVQESIEASGFAIRSQIIWAKDRFALSRGDYHWQHEPCWYAVRGTGHWTGDRSQSTLWNIPAREDSGHGHSTQKPVECMRRPIENNSSAGQAVYDPFVGSGTTIIAAEIMGRVCHAIEIAPAYCDVTVERWQNFTGQKAERIARDAVAA